MGLKEVKPIDDVFKFRAIENFALGLLLFGIMTFVFGIFLTNKIGDKEKVLFQNLYRQRKLVDLKENAEKIKANPKNFQIDFLEGDSLVELFSRLKKRSLKVGVLKSFTIANVFFEEGKKIDIIKITIAGETDLDKYHKFLQEMASYNILAKYNFIGTPDKGKYLVDLNVYYKGKLPKNYKKEEYKPEAKDKIEQEMKTVEKENNKKMKKENNEKIEKEKVNKDKKTINSEKEKKTKNTKTIKKPVLKKKK